MMRPLDLTNQVFGKLTAKYIIRKVKKPKEAYNIWYCECECGGSCETKAADLKNGHSTSCGCSRIKHHIIGEKFGNLTVIRKTDQLCVRFPLYECKCDCGGTHFSTKSNLVMGSVKSCGCLWRLPETEASFNQVYDNYKRNAKKRNKPFQLTKNQARELFQSNCYYCDSEPRNQTKHKNCNGFYTYNGIDRLDSNLGYTLDNVVPCCKWCNISKRDRELKDFLDWAAKLSEHLEEKGLI